MSAKCKSCGAEIEWCRTASGKRIPMDLGEVDLGNLCVVGGVAQVYGSGARAMGYARRRTHYASCPQAAQWRQR